MAGSNHDDSHGSEHHSSSGKDSGGEGYWLFTVAIIVAAGLATYLGSSLFGAFGDGELTLDNATTQSLLALIVLAPLGGAMANGFAVPFGTGKKLAATIGIGSVVISLICAAICFNHIMGLEGHKISYTLWNWFEIGGSPVQIRFVMDSLSGIMVMVITGIGLLIHIYSWGYMHDDPGLPRFYTYLNLFMASMLILVLGSSIPVMFIGWEGVGLCSYLLIGFWWENTDYAKAGRKAFVVNRVGDCGVILGMLTLFAAVGSFEFETINANAGALGQDFLMGQVALGSFATAAGIFLFIGCAGKSAQLPLYVWLPDAMAGPTPVSALIHAATMVTAGVYLCCRLSNVFLASATTLTVIAVVGTLTALLAASIALVQNDLKKVLAYSTVSQLGFMFAAVGVGAFTAGIFHVFTHAFFKACLFLGAGAVMHAVHAHGDADMRKLGGLKDILKKEHLTFAIATAAIAGVPLTSGFFSKEGILGGATMLFENESANAPAAWVGWFVLIGLFIAATMTAFYMFRLYFMTFWGEYRSAEGYVDSDGHMPVHHDDHHEHSGDGDGHDHDGDDHGHEHGYDPHPHANGVSIWMPLAILAFGAIAAGFLNAHILGIHTWDHWLESSVSNLGGSEGNAMLALILGTVAMLAGIGGAFVMYGKGQPDKLPDMMPSAVHSFLFNKWKVDELYGATLVKPITWLARFSAQLDAIAVDGILAKLTAFGVSTASFIVTRFQNGVVYVYGAFIVFGMALGGWWFLYPHANLTTMDATGRDASFAAAPGLGYEYRWDFNSDDEFETEWSDARKAEFQYTDDFTRPVFLTLDGHHEMQVKSTQTKLSNGAIHWEPDVTYAEDGTRLEEVGPTVERAPGNGITITANDAPLKNAEGAEVEAITLSPGDTATVGAVAVRAHVGGELALVSLNDLDVREDLDEEAFAFDEDDLTPSWAPSDFEGTPTPPSIRVEDGEIILRKNDAIARVGGAVVEDEEIKLSPGSIVTFGVPMPSTPVSRYRIVPVVEATVEVRNAFGQVGSSTRDLYLGVTEATRAQEASLEQSPRLERGAN